MNKQNCLTNDRPYTLKTVFRVLILVFSFAFIFVTVTFANDSTTYIKKIISVPDRLVDGTNRKIHSLTSILQKQTKKYLRKLAKQEARLKKKIISKDSSALATLFSYNPAERYTALLKKIETDTASYLGVLAGQYFPYVDSLQGALSFIKEKGNLSLLPKNMTSNISGALKDIGKLQSGFKQADFLKQLMKQRQEQIKQYLSKYTHIPASLKKMYNNYSKQVYYYEQQVQEYKNIFNHPDKLLTTALKWLNKTPAFKSFMQRNSQLAGLFNTGGTNATFSQNIIGLQTRNQVVTSLFNQAGNNNNINPNQFVQQQLKDAIGKTNSFQNQLNLFDKKSDNLNLPNYLPNKQHTKKFLQRLEYGTNLQTQTGTNHFPITTDLGFSIGYKLNDKSIIGVGTSYKIGWGKDLRNINISSQGAGIRSFLDWKLKGGFFVSGGFEFNYQQPFTSLQQIRLLNNWSQSGLIGASKIISLKTKFFKKSKLQLLWDFLSYRQLPRTQAFKFRIGYNF